MKNLTRFFCLLMALVMTFGLMTPAFAADGEISDTNPELTDEFVPEDDLLLVTSFKDVKSSDWFYADVTNCAKLGIVAGFEDGTFKPNDSVTGVQFAAMLTRTFYNKELDKVTVPAGQKWYYQYVTCAKNVGISDSTLEFKDANINRYDMARALYNIIAKNNKLASTSNQAYQDTVTSIKDYKQIPTNRLIAVRQCYALGIIMGMSDGTFSGSGNMTRAQACTVIMRMLKLINNYNPGDLDNDEYDDGKSQDTGNGNTGNNNNQTSSGKLANGQDATVANVSALLEQIKAKYPNGYNYYAKFITHGNTNCGFNNLTCQWPSNQGGTTSTTSGCGGFAHMVSDTIFGESGAPARQVTDHTKLRPGDIVIGFSDKTHTKLSHVAIVYKTTVTNGTMYYSTCDAGPDNGVKWNTNVDTPTSWLTNPNMCAVAYTRYPD